MQHTVTLHGRLEHRFRRGLVEPRALAQFERIVGAAPWMTGLERRINAILSANASVRSRFGKLVELAGEIERAIAPHAGCRRRCSSCCNISVSLASIEADRLGKQIGRAPARPPADQAPDQLAERYFGTPCPFLVNETCSIYTHRPLACRLHFTLDADEFFCRTTIAPSESIVPNVDLRIFWLGYGLLSAHAGSGMGDIRQFFPKAQP